MFGQPQKSKKVFLVFFLYFNVQRPFQRGNGCVEMDWWMPPGYWKRIWTLFMLVHFSFQRVRIKNKRQEWQKTNAKING